MDFKIYTEPFCSVSFGICCVGLVSNLLIILSTFRRDSVLRSKSNYLLCILAVFDLATVLGFMQVIIQIWLGLGTILNVQCFHLLLPQIFSMNAGTFLIGGVALDRFLMLKFPVKYRTWKTRPYVLTITLIALSYSSFTIVLGFVCASHNVSVQLCMPPTGLLGAAKQFWVFSNLALSVTVICSQAATYRMSYKAQGESAATVAMLRRLGKSVLVVTAVYVCGWATTVSVLSLLSILHVSPSTHFHGSLYVGWGAMINVSCNGIIYAWRSKDYRREYMALIKMRTGPATVMVTRGQTRHDYGIHALTAYPWPLPLVRIGHNVRRSNSV